MSETTPPVSSMTCSPRRPLGTVLAPLRRHARWLWPFGAALLLTYLYFVPAPAWNQNSRLALTRALVEQQTTAIDATHATTGDKSFRNGHFYSDKAPGISWLSIPPYAVLYATRTWSGGELPGARVVSLDPRVRAAARAIELDARLPGDRLVYNRTHVFALWLCAAFCVALPTVAGCAAVFLLALAATRRRQTATWVALCAGAATPLWVYATSLYGHALCGASLVSAFSILTLLPPRSARSRSAAWAMGGLLSLAVVTEYPAAVIAIAFVAIAARVHGWRFAAHVCAAALPLALCLAAYHTSAFGHPLRTGYDFVYREEFASGMAVRYGLGWPDVRAGWTLLFGSYRGLFYLSPVLVLAAWGLVMGSVRGGGTLGTRGYRIALAVTVYFWALNAGYYMWDGGAATGPRHMVPALPFFALGLAHAWTRVPQACAALAVVSALQMLLLATASPEAPQFGNPLWEHAIGEAASRGPDRLGAGTNLGALLGLRGLWSVVPLLAAWAWLWPRDAVDPARRDHDDLEPT